MIRTPTVEDLPRINALIANVDDCFIDASIPDCDDPQRFRRSFVVESDGHMMGLGSISSNWLHPSRVAADLVVAPSNRRQGVGAALLKHLIAAIPAHDGRPLKASCWDDDEASIAFWRKQGFAPIMQTDVGTIDLTASAQIVPSATTVDEEITVVSGDEVDLTDAQWDGIATLQERVYRANHAWSPVASIDLPLAHKLFLDSDDLIPDALFVALQDGRPFAVASLRALSDDGQCELGWAGGDPESGHIGTWAARLLASRCLTLAYERGWTVSVEADHADPVLHRIIEDWPLVSHRVWVTHEKQRMQFDQTP